MEISFARMNGLGNRFAIIDDRKLCLRAGVAEGLATRIEGIDQLLVLQAPRGEGALFMAIYNSDGSQAEACGNGVRCVAWLGLEAMKETTATASGGGGGSSGGGATDSIAIETLGGLVMCRRRGDLIEADMGLPKFDWQEIPLSQARDTLNLRFDEVPTAVGLGTAVNVGNPHLVFFPSVASSSFDWRALGEALGKHPLFSHGVNVSFVSIKDEGLVVDVWERGAGATQACGTAACASLVAACRRFPVMPRTAPVRLAGGLLEIHWRAADNHILMTGGITWESAGSIQCQE